MSIRLALAGDTMLGRGVADRLSDVAPRDLFSDEVRGLMATADLTVLNLECCVSDRGEQWDPKGKMFHFRAPPRAVEALTALGVDCVTLANNHALDFGYEALADTRAYLAQAGIAVVGAGGNIGEARAPALLEARGTRVAVVGVTDHPRDFAAGSKRPGVAYADLRTGVPGWLEREIRRWREETGAVLVTPHWGPNMVPQPLAYVRAAANRFMAAGATLVAGHSAHVFHGVAGAVLYDLGDFIDDYAVHTALRNDHGVFFLVTLEEGGPVEVRAVPIALDYGHTRLAVGAEWAWIRDRLDLACAEWGTRVWEDGGQLVVETRR